jgi:hypothetical protein
VDCEASDIFSAELDLTRVQSAADIQSQGANGITDGCGTRDCSGWTVEGRQDTVTHGLDLAAVVPRQLVSHHSVVQVERVPPASIADAQNMGR